ncbi:DUF7836 family putative zinc-binding protein [Halobiforma nitratireducens]|uniref:DUF7836 domain-containing protein n=1 Tax=Halobiforma nitratireducens JCM 10879 TaxID=1227454 RepID=M0M8P7_9EURY|nr:hypothetical protein [Halobiforma nitratireducens]EMA41718.1 hypothetical protein C446_05365 [Halobiforma nitratireducens JCM 10879]
MREPWIDLECPSCHEQWESDPADLPEPGKEFGCEHCDDRRPVSEFVKTSEGLEIHESFHV